MKLKLKSQQRLIEFATTTGGYHLRVVESYNYLGQKLVASCSHTAEITQRKSSCLNVMGPIAARYRDAEESDHL